MTPAAGSKPHRGWRPWSELTQVERVGLYTRQSLYLVIVATNAVVLTTAAWKFDDPAQVWVLLAGGVVVTAASLWTLRAIIEADSKSAELPMRRIAVLLCGSAAYLGVAALTGSDAANDAAVAVVVTSVCFALGVVRDSRVAIGLLVGAGLVAGLHEPKAATVSVTVLAAASFIAAGRASMWLLGIVRDLDSARRAQSELAVMEERLRFSRDVHDVLGRRLSTIAVQAELAATLAQRGDTRAPERMLEVRSVAHQALREARELARGYRQTHFGQELEGARSLLRSAGIDVQLSVEDMPQAWHEPAGWVVRECVTNVLRHSRASVVTITFADDRLQVGNDGAQPQGAGDGAGLQGLRERLAPLGASLVVEPLADGYWSVVAQFPGAGPLSTRAARREDA